MYIFRRSVLSTSNLKLHKTHAMDNTFIQEKLLPRSTFNPGLVLTGFRTTRPSVTRGTVRVNCLAQHNFSGQGSNQEFLSLGRAH